MPIARVDTRVVSTALERAFFAGSWAFRSVDQIIVRVRADEGEGLGLAFTFDPGTAAAVAALIDGLAGVLIGRDPIEVEARHEALTQAVTFAGYGGPAAMAVGALDTALWDICAQAYGLPLASLLGGEAKAVPAYVTVGSLDLSLTELATEAERQVASGFRAVKVKVGGEPADGVMRVRVVRSVVGPQVALLVDANQTLTAKAALELARGLADEGVAWLEEPLPWWDVDGAARLVASSPVPIAIGESLFSPYPFYDAVKRGAAGMLVANVARIGGVTEWMRVAALADARGLGISGHVLPEISAHVVAASPSGRYIEIVPWWPSVFAEALRLEEGALMLTDAAGLGLTLDDRIVRT